jgi:hypothetical protein
MAKQSTGWIELQRAGFTVHKGWHRKWYEVTAPDGTPGVVLRQSSHRWHFFWSKLEATASGSSPETCMDGGLGDVIDNDGQLRTYRGMVLNAPGQLLTRCDALYRESSNVYNS